MMKFLDYDYKKLTSESLIRSTSDFRICEMDIYNIVEFIIKMRGKKDNIIFSISFLMLIWEREKQVYFVALKSW